MRFPKVYSNLDAEDVEKSSAEVDSTMMSFIDHGILPMKTIRGQQKAELFLAVNSTQTLNSTENCWIFSALIREWGGGGNTFYVYSKNKI